MCNAISRMRPNSADAHLESTEITIRLLTTNDLPSQWY
jgi:hypothetical protein